MAFYTTGADGSYILYNLDVGVNTVTVQKSGFYTTNEDVEVLAQADPTIQNFILSPDMPYPVGLAAEAGDGEVHLKWRSPGSMEIYDIAYYDDQFEGQIGCGGPCQFTVRFTPELSGIYTNRFSFIFPRRCKCDRSLS